MKRALILGWLSLLVAGCFASDPMAGRWKGKDASGGEVVLFLEGGGKFEAISKGERLVGTWSTNKEQEPTRIDLVVEGRTISSIVKLQDDNLLIEQVGADGKLPTAFTSKATFYKREP